mmetsp:Transcript_30093/g.64939  ORF Transcript_30093/g.64939 Transcript_30093/m.64939 type:complete len:160 (-) Transcript_30093:302-781(-)
MTSLVKPIRVPTNLGSTPRTKQRQIDLNRISETDLKTLQHEDPFMYYSIPTAAYYNSNNNNSSSNNSSSSNSNYNAIVSNLVPPAREQDEEPPEGTCLVTRKSRLSTECHMDVMMEEILLLLDHRVYESDSDMKDDDDDDDFIKVLFRANIPDFEKVHE